MSVLLENTELFFHPKNKKENTELTSYIVYFLLWLAVYETGKT